MFKTIALFFLVIFTVSCNNNDDNNSGGTAFCSKERNLNQEVTQVVGTLIYISDRNVIAIRYYPNYPSIDEVRFCVLCEQPDRIIVDDVVRFSGKLYDFNSDEGYDADVAGAEFFYLEATSIAKISIN